MMINVSFKQMPSSVALESYARTSLGARIQKFIKKESSVHLTFEVEGLDHVVKCHIHSDAHCEVQLEQRASNMYAAIDLLGHRVEKVLRKIKDKRKPLKLKEPMVHLMKLANRIAPDLEEPVDGGEIIAFERAKNRQAVSLFR